MTKMEPGKKAPGVPSLHMSRLCCAHIPATHRVLTITLHRAVRSISAQICHFSVVRPDGLGIRTAHWEQYRQHHHSIIGWTLDQATYEPATRHLLENSCASPYRLQHHSETGCDSYHRHVTSCLSYSFSI